MKINGWELPIFVENIVLVAASEEELQRMLDVVASYSENGK